jgi:hypothetical protein
LKVLQANTCPPRQPKDATAPILGLSTQLDRNINSAGDLGFDLTGSQQDLERHALPTFVNYTVDINLSAGAFVEASGQGTVQIRYTPTLRHFKGQSGSPGNGTAYITVKGLLLTFNQNNPTRNSDIGI